ncbi:MAG: DMT family transporter [Balneolaceae bacterium]
MKKLFNNKWFLLIVIALTWGSSFILIKKSLVVFTPNEIGAIRVGVSGLILAYIGFPVLKEMSRTTLFWITITGFFGNFLPMFLFPLAQTEVSSSLAGILDSLVPAFVLVLGFFLFGIRSRGIQILGAVVGFLGAVSLLYFSETNSENSQFWYALLVVLATACYAVSALILKEKLAHVPSLKISAAVFTIWMVPSFAILIFSGFFQNIEATPQTYEALAYLSILSIVGTAIAMILYYKLIQNTTAIFASAVTYLLPIVAVLWGILDGEKFTAWHLFGGLLILIGIYLIGKNNDTSKVLTD